MKPGGYTHPWNFNVKPSQYVRYSSESNSELEKALEEVSLDELDELFLHTLECPAVKVLDPHQKKELRSIANEYNYSSLALVVSHAKPGGNFKTKNLTKAKEVLPSYGIHTTRYPDYFNWLNISFDKRGNEESIKGYHDCKNKLLSNKAHDLILGILYGYPIGDVMEYTTQVPMFKEFEKYQKICGRCKELDVLLHVPTPFRWNGFWRTEFGMSAEEYLAKIYRDLL